MSIGIFDSGVGGLTVLKEVRKVLPNEKIIYLTYIKFHVRSHALIYKFLQFL